MTAEKKADENRVVAVEKTEEEIAQLMKKAEQKIAEKKEQMLQELKKDVAGLVVMATEKVLDEKIDNNKDGELIKKATDKL
jgi:F0F1-type ATP synthase membrane subunit b/b'